MLQHPDTSATLEPVVLPRAAAAMKRRYNGRTVRRLIALTTVALALLAASAEAVTSKEILELSRAGLGDEVLLALIEADGGVFTLDADTLSALKQAGVSERVILAMVRSGRTRPAQAPDPEPAVAVQAPPQVIVIDHEAPVVQQVAVPVAVPVPVYVPVYPTRISRRVGARHIVEVPFDPSPGFGAPLPRSVVREKAEPVYWGWGGKLRPDAWKPENERRN